MATIYLGRQLPGASSDQTRGVSGQPHPPPIWSCSGWGLPSKPVSRFLVRSYRTVAPLSGTQRQRSMAHNLASDAAFSQNPASTSLPLSAGRYIFCGTGLRVTPTGRYPAPCPAELGLSSRTASRSCSRGCLAYSGPPRLLGSEYNMPPAGLSKRTRRRRSPGRLQV